MKRKNLTFYSPAKPLEDNLNLYQKIDLKDLICALFTNKKFLQKKRNGAHLLIKVDLLL